MDDIIPLPDRWVSQAACRGMDPAMFFSFHRSETEKAKQVCSICPVKDECAAEAIDMNYTHGVWGQLVAHDNDVQRIRRRRRYAQERDYK